MNQRRPQVRDFDWITISLFMALLVSGWLMIYTSEFDPENPTSIFNFGKSSGKQFVWIGIALSLALVTIIVESKFFSTFAFGFYGIAIALLVLVLIFAPEVNGARSWFNFGGFKFQPSEFAKVTTCLALAAFLGSYNFNIKDFGSRIRALGIIILPMALVLLQKDAGSMLVYASFFIVLYRAGMPDVLYIGAILLGILVILALVLPPEMLILALTLLGLGLLLYQQGMNAVRLTALGLVIAGSVLAVNVISPWYISAMNAGLMTLLMIFRWGKRWQVSLFTVLSIFVAGGIAFSVNYVFQKLPSHQQDRINMWLKPESCDPQGPILNLIQSKNAIGSGGVTGKGFLQGELTKYGFVSEDNTDFIFCAIGEEQGFVGSVLVVILFTALLLRIVFLAERQRSGFSRYYAYGVAGILFIHFFINMGMTMGLVPIIGIPLPFISYGGSSLISFTLLLAILIKLDSNRLLVFR